MRTTRVALPLGALVAGIAGCVPAWEKVAGNTGDTAECASPDCGCGGTTEPLTLYSDADGDGAGDPNAAFASCGPAAGAVTDSTDCDDTNRLVHPGAAEICDGADNDCDATTVESGAAFVGAAGGVDDLTLALAAGAPSAPVPLLLPIDGALYLCAGDWHTSLVIDADVAVVGVAGWQATSILGSDLVPGIVVDGPRDVSIRGLTIDDAANVDVNGVAAGGALACAGGATVTASELVLHGADATDELLLGGLISVRDGCTLDLSGSVLFDGAGLYGGQLFVEGATANVATTEFTGGYAGIGGAALVGNFLAYKGYTGGGQVASFTCTDCTFSDNEAGFYLDVDDHFGLGAAIAAFGDAIVTVTGGSFADNGAGSSGGAVAIFPSEVGSDPTLPQVVFDGVVFDGNTGATLPSDVYIGADPPFEQVFGAGPQSAVCGPAVCE